MFLKMEPSRPLSLRPFKSLNRTNIRQSAHESALTNVAPEFPDDTMLQRLQEDEGLRSLLRIEEHQVPGTKAHAKQAKSARSAAAEPSEVFPRRWLLDPALSPMGASYGYAQLQRGPEGELFAVMKFPRFYLTPDESGGFDVQSRHGVTRACIALDVLSYDDFMLVQEAVDTLELGEMDADTLQQTVKVLSESAASFGNPFTLYLTAFSAEGQVFNPFEETRFRRRGGQENVELSALFHVEDCVAVYTKQFVDALAGVKNPFKDILFLSDGLCGSSCDTAARTAYMLSQQLAVEEGTPKVRFAAFGGLGGTAAEARRTLSATSFPGGNVMSSAMGLLYNPVFSVAALGYLAALWAGLESMQTQLANFQRLVPQYPYYWEKLPKYPQSEMYQKALGQHSLPAEYYFFPTDFVLPDWYRGIDGMPNRWNESELARLHWDALGAFSGSAWRAAPEAEGSWLMAAFSTGRLGGGGHVVPAVGVAICFVLAAGLAQISKFRRPERADPEVQKVKQHQEDMPGAPAQSKEVYDLSRTTSALQKRDEKENESDKLRAELTAVEEARKSSQKTAQKLLATPAAIDDVGDRVFFPTAKERVRKAEEEKRAQEAAAEKAAAEAAAPPEAPEEALASARRRAKEGKEAAASALEPPAPGKEVWQQVRLPLRFHSREAGEFWSELRARLTMY
ncbi:unnamed protein product [Effrenium voratum]|nr:unnamed protein product [Effrenium voratum]